jgi:hypothetical protein
VGDWAGLTADIHVTVKRRVSTGYHRTPIIQLVSSHADKAFFLHTVSAGSKTLPHLHSVQAVSGTHLASYPTGTGDSWGVKSTTHLHQELKLRYV